MVRLLLVFLLLSGTASAQYPARAIRLLVPNPPGGATDTLARVFAPRLTEALGQPVVVENRPGSNGNLAMEAAAHAAPDGHTLLLCADAQIVIGPHLYAKMPLDTLKDLDPVTTLANTQMVLSVSPALPVRNLQEFVEYARRASPPLAYASIGNGSQHHLVMEMFKARAGIDLMHVPFKGGGPAMADVIAGNTEICLGSLIQMIPHVDNKRLKILGIGGKNRAKVYPNVPTIAESGLPGYDASNWWGLLAPAKTPKPVVDRLRAETAKILAQPELQKKFEGQGAETVKMGPDEFGRFIKAEMVKWGRVVKEAGIKAE
jgi:tripartite-type tricarboxylate transporter receptor subunit TctC